jgi:hypothetical protein
MTESIFDILICVGPNDEDIIQQNLLYTKKNIIGYRNIYLVCSNPNITFEETTTIDEKIFPFSKEELLQILINVGITKERIGWYVQQLIKLYAGKIIPGILNNYLVIDCDTHFLKPTKFITDNGKPIFTTGPENDLRYYKLMNFLHPTLKKNYPLSGISHHMFFQTDKCYELIKLVEDYHLNNKPFWKMFLEIKKYNYDTECSEYETYFNFMAFYYPNKIEIRQLQWENVKRLNINSLCDYQSVHWYMRK